MQKQTLNLTTASPTKRIGLDGPHQVEIGGTWGGGTLTPYGYSDENGRGGQLYLEGAAFSTTVDDTIICSAALSEWDLTGSTGADLTIVFTPIKSAVIR